MSALTDAIRARALQWITYAEEDLRLAKHALTMSSGCPYRLIAYHAQQCAEKYLKSFLVFHSIEFPFTHNIQSLLQLCSTKATWAGGLKEAEELTPFSVTLRYPGMGVEVSREQALRAIELTGRVKAEVRKSLSNEGLSIPEDA